MKMPMPKASVYDREYDYLPWGDLMQKVLNLIIEHAPPNGLVADLMCGPGWLISNLADKREDLTIHGVDINHEYVRYANQRLKDKGGNVFVLRDDIHKWIPCRRYDVVVCTGGLHYLKISGQSNLVNKIAQKIVISEGLVIFADPAISAYQDEKTRRKRVTELGAAYICEAIDRNAPKDVLEATVDILKTDLLGFKFKRKLFAMKDMYEHHFGSVEAIKVWPEYKTACGDYIFVCQKTQGL